MKPLVIYHADCTDGYGAAFAAWLKFGDEAEYLPASYGKTSVDLRLEVRGREVYVLDFSFPRDQMETLFSLAKRVVWLDHHKTAFEMWCDDGERNRCEQSNGRDYVLLDNAKSGAYLAWEYFHPNTEVPMLIRHIDDRDRWQWKLLGSAELHVALSARKPWKFQYWQDETGVGGGHSPEFEMKCLEKLKQQGAAILRAQKQHVEQMAKQARACEIKLPMPNGGWKTSDPWHFLGRAVNTSLHQSEVGHELANVSGTYGLVWYVSSDLRVRCSLRSNGEYDVSSIARSFGGGGHRNAAGFETDIETLMEWLK